MKTNSYWMRKLNGAEFKVMRLQESPTANDAVDCPERVVSYLRDQTKNSNLYNPDVENMMVIYLNTRMKPIGWQIISTGTLDTLLVHPREIFKGAIIVNSSAIVLAHNHPSGDPQPSEADIKVTRDLIKAGELLRIPVQDHMVLGNTTDTSKGYCSLRELGYFYN
jgi:DNA repair protein RadC